MLYSNLMLPKILSLEHLIEKVLGLIGLAILAILTFLYPYIVSFLSQVPQKALAEIIIRGTVIFVLLVILLSIIISFLYSQNKELQAKDLFVYYYGARWRINRAKKTIYEKPFCNCSEHDPIECTLEKAHEYQTTDFVPHCPKLSWGHPIYLRDETGKILSIQECVKLIKKREFNK